MIERRAIYSLLLVGMTVLTATSAIGCATGKAQIAEQAPALVVPPVPPRAIEPPVIAEPPPAEPLPEVAPVPTTAAKPAGRSNRTAKPEPESKPEPVETPAPASPPPVAPLRTPATPSGPEAARQVRETLERAKGVLNRVDFQKLSDDRKANYKAAQNYIEQGLDALKKDDVTLARSFAERAENIARQLEPGR
jgi:outer membrane biosynthesis protein TonB